MLRAFGDGTDGWLEIEFCGTNLHILVRRDSVKPGGWMSCVGYSQLAAESNRRNATMMVRGAYDFRIRHRAQQIADQRVQLGICHQGSRRGGEKGICCVMCFAGGPGVHRLSACRPGPRWGLMRWSAAE